MHVDFEAFLVLATAISGLIWLVDAVAFAPKRKAAHAAEHGGQGAAVERAPEPLMVEYAKSFFPVFLIVLLLRSFLLEPFRIPSGSMRPTLLVGDFILVNKWAYGIRLPVLHKKVVEISDPQRGDVVVFRFPQDTRVDFIKRIIGLPGDRIGYRGKTIYLNGTPVQQSPDGDYEGVGSNEMGPVERRTESLADHPHKVLVDTRSPDFPGGCQVLLFGDVVVPEGHYFVMGDNRDYSNDGRCWGFVPDENLVGRAFGIWMTWDLERPGFPVDWARIGNGIQ